MTEKTIAPEMLATAQSEAIAKVLEACRPHYDPPPEENEASRALHMDAAALAKENQELQDRHWLGELMGMFFSSQKILESEGSDAFKQTLKELALLKAPDRMPITYGFLKHQLAKALIKELGIEGEMALHSRPAGGLIP